MMFVVVQHNNNLFSSDQPVQIKHFIEYIHGIIVLQCLFYLALRDTCHI